MSRAAASPATPQLVRAKRAGPWHARLRRESHAFNAHPPRATHAAAARRPSPPLARRSLIPSRGTPARGRLCARLAPRSGDGARRIGSRRQTWRTRRRSAAKRRRHGSFLTRTNAQGMGAVRAALRPGRPGTALPWPPPRARPSIWVFGSCWTFGVSCSHRLVRPPRCRTRLGGPRLFPLAAGSFPPLGFDTLSLVWSRARRSRA
jgi:hypothetical protein